MNNSIIAAKTVVNSKFKEGNVIIGGVPAKILKRDIDWSFEKIYIVFGRG